MTTYYAAVLGLHHFASSQTLTLNNRSHFGILPPLEPHVRDKRQRYAAYVERALADLDGVLAGARTT